MEEEVEEEEEEEEKKENEVYRSSYKCPSFLSNFQKT